MRFFKLLLLGICMSSLIHFWVFGLEEWSQGFQAKWVQLFDGNGTKQHVEQAKSPEIEAASTNQELPSFSTSIHAEQENLFIGMSTLQLEEQLGKPERIEPSAYGYEWWIFNEDWSNYIQIGVLEGEVVTFYTNAPNRNWRNLAPGMLAEEWQKHWVRSEEVSFQHDLGFYTFTLTSDEQQERPLFIDQKTAIQLYIDVHDRQRISGIRVMDLNTLLLYRPYGLKYIGKLPDHPSLTADEWEQVAAANERQVFDLVNITRKRNHLPEFEWHEEVARVARGHSADMLVNQYFDHHSPKYGDLGNRLDHGDVQYLAAGENIAWNYVDAPDAHEGWLNSIGHRKNVLKEGFTHLGVGIVEKYYTQNFIMY